MALVRMLHRHNSKHVVTNYRGISLLDITGKILSMRKQGNGNAGASADWGGYFHPENSSVLIRATVSMTPYLTCSRASNMHNRNLGKYMLSPSLSTSSEPTHP
jgi:hypothetical protein